MKHTYWIVLPALLLLSGCTVLDGLTQGGKSRTSNTSASVTSLRSDCIFAPVETQDIEHCDLDYWLGYWIEQSELTWPQRRTRINQLDNSPEATLKKILLSQYKGTPYQDRLRAQGWADELFPNLDDRARKIFRVMVFQPSQELLEFESALTILTRINTNQSKQIEAQKIRLQTQQQQIDQLLKIEASMMEKKEDINQ